MRQHWRASNLLNPVPTALITCTDENGKSNVMTAAWVGTICSDPVMVSVSIRKKRYSHDIIARTKELVINLTSEDLVLYADYVGIYSGAKVDKFSLDGKYKVTPVESEKVKAITIDECPIALECKVVEIKELGSHDMFICEVLSVSVKEEVLDENGRLDMERAKLVAYCHGEYYGLGKKIGRFGYSSFKKERNKRTEQIRRNRKENRNK